VRDRRISVGVPGRTPEHVPTALADERVRLIRTRRSDA
jgi:hypothetical protein